MPYITQKDRDRFGPLVRDFRQLDDKDGLTCGDLNYLFTKFIHIILKQHGTSYPAINSIIGVLECCKMELYRRVVADYEDEKIEENGDVA